MALNRDLSLPPLGVQFMYYLTHAGIPLMIIACCACCWCLPACRCCPCYQFREKKFGPLVPPSAPPVIPEKYMRMHEEAEEEKRQQEKAEEEAKKLGLPPEGGDAPKAAA